MLQHRRHYRPSAGRCPSRSSQELSPDLRSRHVPGWCEWGGVDAQMAVPVTEPAQCSVHILLITGRLLRLRRGTPHPQSNTPFNPSSNHQATDPRNSPPPQRLGPSTRAPHLTRPPPHQTQRQQILPTTNRTPRRRIPLHRQHLPPPPQHQHQQPLLAP